MSKVNGVKVLVKIYKEGTAILLAGQRGASLSRSAETLDATSKDSDGWKQSIAGFKEWSIDCDGAFVQSDEAYSELERAFIASENVDVEIVMPAGKTYKGNATLTSFDMDFPYDDLVTYSLSLQGSGALNTQQTAGPAN